MVNIEYILQNTEILRIPFLLCIIVKFIQCEKDAAILLKDPFGTCYAVVHSLAIEHNPQWFLVGNALVIKNCSIYNFTNSRTFNIVTSNIYRVFMPTSTISDMHHTDEMIENLADSLSFSPIRQSSKSIEHSVESSKNVQVKNSTDINLFDKIFGDIDVQDKYTDKSNLLQEIDFLNSPNFDFTFGLNVQKMYSNSR